MVRQTLYVLVLTGCLAAVTAWAQPIPYDDPVDDSALQPPPPVDWSDVAQPATDDPDMADMPEVVPDDIEAYGLPTSEIWAQPSAYATYPQYYDPGYSTYDSGYGVYGSPYGGYYSAPVTISYYTYDPWWYQQSVYGVYLGCGYRPAYRTYYGGGYVTYGPGVSTYSGWYPTWYVSPYNTTYGPYRTYGHRRYYGYDNHRNSYQPWPGPNDHDWHNPWSGSIDRDHRGGRDRNDGWASQNPSGGRSYSYINRNDGSRNTNAVQRRNNTPWIQQITGNSPVRRTTSPPRTTASGHSNMISRLLQPHTANTNANNGRSYAPSSNRNIAPAPSAPRRTSAAPAPSTPRNTNQRATVRPAPTRVSRPATVQPQRTPTRQPAPARQPAPQRVRTRP